MEDLSGFTTEEILYRSIAKYSLDEVIEKLFTVILKVQKSNAISDLEDKHNELISLSARYHKLNHEKMVGIISSENANLENNKIVYALTSLVKGIADRLEKTDYSIRKYYQSNIIKIKHDSTKLNELDSLSEYSYYNTRLLFNNIHHRFDKNGILWNLKADRREQVGLNLIISSKKGFIEFEYLVKDSNLVSDNIIFFVIPMTSNHALIELGTNKVDHIDNEYSPFRVRKIAKNIKNTWFTERIDYDFTNYSEVE